MINQLTHVNVWVHDQDEALAFYTGKLGFELRDDVTVPEMGDFRWLTVGPVGQPDVALTLMRVPGPPVFEPETAEQVRSVVAKGAAGGLFFSVDDCRATAEELRGRGVEFIEEPMERPYGIDAAIRDPSGNHIRLVQTTTDGDVG
jgi:catechol 2,3-dioxygenase-like lactoylglutathione lyase family enzyme